MPQQAVNKNCEKWSGNELHSIELRLRGVLIFLLKRW